MSSISEWLTFDKLCSNGWFKLLLIMPGKENCYEESFYLLAFCFCKDDPTYSWVSCKNKMPQQVPGIWIAKVKLRKQKTVYNIFPREGPGG